MRGFGTVDPMTVEGYTSATYVRFLLTMDREARVDWHTRTDQERARLVALDYADFEKTGTYGTRALEWTRQFWIDAVRIGRENTLEAQLDELTATIRKLLPEETL